MNHQRLTQVSASLAAKSNCKYRHGTIIVVSGGRIIGRGYNRWCPSKEFRSYWTLHSEIAALLNTPDKNNLSGAVVSNCRINSSGFWSNSEPCPTCKMILTEHGIKTIWYTNKVGKITKDNEDI